VIPYNFPALPVMNYKWPALCWGHFACAFFIIIVIPIAAMEECSQYTSIDCGICLKLTMHIVGDWGMKSNLSFANVMRQKGSRILDKGLLILSDSTWLRHDV